MLRALKKSLHAIANLVVVQCSQTHVVRIGVPIDIIYGVPISNETEDAVL